MSVNIATMGLFQECCGGPGGGGAPPYRQNASEETAPLIFVKNVDMKTTNSIEDYLSKIKAKLISFDNK